MAGSFQDRVKKLAEHVGGPAELVRRTKLSRRTIGAYMSGETDPKRGDLLKLASAGDVSLEWLAAGEGEMLGEAATPAARLRYHSDALRAEMRVAEPRAGYVHLPLYELSAGAAPRGKLVSQVEQPVSELAFREDWIRNTLHTTPDKLTLIHVEGDSMDPDLRAGDIILVDHTDTTARREGIYVLRMEDALLVKTVQRLPGGLVKLISRNEAYGPITLPIPKLDVGGEVSIIGRVVWACRRL